MTVGNWTFHEQCLKLNFRCFGSSLNCHSMYMQHDFCFNVLVTYVITARHPNLQLRTDFLNWGQSTGPFSWNKDSWTEVNGSQLRNERKAYWLSANMVKLDHSSINTFSRSRNLLWSECVKRLNDNVMQDWLKSDDGTGCWFMSKPVQDFMDSDIYKVLNCIV